MENGISRVVEGDAMPVISYPIAFFFGHYYDNIILWQKSVKLRKKGEFF